MKKLFTFILVALLPLMASAAVNIDGIWYNFSGDEATVTSGSPSYSGDVVIPESVTYNGQTYSVTSIGDWVFNGCSRLTSITIPESVSSIGECAFQGCSGLTSITIPNSVTNIGRCAFAICDGLTSVHITDLTAWCNIPFPSHDANPLLYAHHLCINGEEITDLVVPDDVTSIGSYAFYSCIGLTSVTIPNSVTSIGRDAFYNCSNLTSVHITDLTAWCNISFNNSYSNPLSYAEHLYLNGEEVTNIVIPEDMTSIGDYTFDSCIGLTSVTIPNGVTSIGRSTFKGCSGLTEITIPNSVTIIGVDAFRKCSGLTSLIVPESVETIGNSAFYGCKLRSVLVKCDTPPSVSSGTFSDQTYYHTTLYIPTSSWDAYAYDDYWYKFINIRETAMAEEQLSMHQTYTMMDASTFVYSVYDPVNDCIGSISSVSSIDENNPNHSWQVIESGGSHYLYNVGAKKFVVASANGSFELTDTPTTIEMSNGDNGIIIGAQTAKQWALVSNERMSAEQSIIDGISLTPALPEGKVEIYDLAGRRIGKLQRGVNIVKQGSAKANGKKVATK